VYIWRVVYGKSEITDNHNLHDKRVETIKNLNINTPEVEMK